MAADSVKEEMDIDTIVTDDLESATEEDEEAMKKRFEIELEFVQTLGDPGYISFLAQRRILEQPAFVNYLHYLQYWKEPEYRKFLKFPQCLYFLDLLQNKRFRDVMIHNEARDALLKQNYLHWKYYYPTRLLEPSVRPEGAQDSLKGDAPVSS